MCERVIKGTPYVVRVTRGDRFITEEMSPKRCGKVVGRGEIKAAIGLTTPGCGGFHPKRSLSTRMTSDTDGVVGFPHHMQLGDGKRRRHEMGTGSTRTKILDTHGDTDDTRGNSTRRDQIKADTTGSLGR